MSYASLLIIDAEFDLLERAGVMQYVNYSLWKASIVLVLMTNEIDCICADYSTGLDAALKMHQYLLPVPDDLFDCFAKPDLSDVYLQTEVNAASKRLLIINTYLDLYQSSSLPLGVRSALAVLQQIVDTMLPRFSGVAAYLDDILIKGSTHQ